MEPISQEEIGPFKVLWHTHVTHDFGKIDFYVAEEIVERAENRLHKIPFAVGTPLKGTSNRLWRIRHRDYRVLYTVNTAAKEVWVLSVRHRSIVYRPEHLESLLQLAIMLNQR